MMVLWLITVFFILFGGAEAAHIIVMLTDKKLETYMFLCGVFCIVFFFMIGVLAYWKYQTKRREKEVKYQSSFSPYMILFILVSLITMFHFIRGYVPDLQDAVYDITLNNVVSGEIMTRHPFLGVETEASMPIRMRVLGLSSIYSVLITLSKQTPYTIMCKIVPLIIWTLSILLYWEFAKKLFDKDIHKRWLFLAMVALVYLITSGSDGLVGQRLFYAGFSGETIRSVLLLPYTIYVSWQKKWCLTALAVVVEACLVWTTYGIGYCFLIAVFMMLVHIWLDRRTAYAA